MSETNSKPMTHLVVDEIYLSNEPLYEAFVGTLEECNTFIEEQGGFAYKVLPLTKEEYIQYNK